MAKGKEPSTSFLKMLNTLRIKSLEVTRAESHPSYVPLQRRMVSEAAGRIAKTNKFHSVKTVPADTQRRSDVLLTSVRRDEVASTSIRRHFDVMCLLEWNKIV